MTLNSTFQQGFFIGLIFLGLVLLNKWRNGFGAGTSAPWERCSGPAAGKSCSSLKIDESKCNQMQPLLDPLSNPGLAVPQRSVEKLGMRLLRNLRRDLPDAGDHLPGPVPEGKLPAVDLTRRRILATSFLAFFSGPFFRISKARKRARDKLIRPPGYCPEIRAGASSAANA